MVEKKSNFKKAFANTILLEGGYSNHPKDRGGKTKFGITKKTYLEAVRQGIIKKRFFGVRGISEKDAEIIYKKFYWDVLRLDEVNNFRIAEEMFDTAVNCGTTRVVRMTQRILKVMGEKVKVDGIIGRVSLAAINKCIKEDTEVLFKLLNCLQGVYYLEITERRPSQKVFLDGWVKKRVDDWNE